MSCGARPNGPKVRLIAILSEWANRTHRIEDEGLARWAVHQRGIAAKDDADYANYSTCADSTANDR